MSRSGGMSQLFKGIIIGVVLIMAIIGTMSLLNKDNPFSASTKNATSSAVTNSPEIATPSITLNPSQNPNKNDNDSTIGDLNAEIPEISNTTEPTLEDEQTAVEAAPEFGMMELKAVNTINNQALKVSYAVFNQENIKVAESKNAATTSYRLPTGQYKVETTLNRVDETTQQTIPAVTKSRYIIVRKNSTSKQTFELEPPANTGVVQVSAKLNDQAIRANFVIQAESGEVIASRNNVTSSLFKLNTGTYKVSVSNGNNNDTRTIEVKAGESIQTVFTLKQAEQQGKLLVRIVDTRTNNPIRADLTISQTNGAVIQKLEATTRSELTLVPGAYKIQVIGPNGSSSRNISVSSGESLNEVFRFDAPNADTVAQNDGIKVTENVTIKPVETQDNTSDTTLSEANRVNLSIVAQDEQTRKPIKSNIYIQTPAGKHLEKKTYVDSANFTLLPGVYKVTVRATNRNNVVKTIRVSDNSNKREIFLLSNPNKPATNQNSTNVIQTGFLNVSMQAPNNQNISSKELNSHFIVATTSGRKVVELTSVNQGNFKLDVGAYVVTAIHKNKRRTQRVNIRANQNTRLAFNTSDFQATKGILRSRIVNESGQPLKGNLTVSNMAGQVVARANNVSTAVFDLAPNRHTINVNYQGLTGSEVVNISSNETTVQTFTIAPNTTTPPPSPQQPIQNNNSSKNIRDILREKLKKEIERNFN